MRSRRQLMQMHVLSSNHREEGAERSRLGDSPWGLGHTTVATFRMRQAGCIEHQGRSSDVKEESRTLRAWWPRGKREHGDGGQ